MAHYLIQVTLGELQAASVGWNVEGGDRYVGFYDAGIAVISGPLIGNPVLPYFEIECSDDLILEDLWFPYELMKDGARRPGHLRWAYKASIASAGNSRSLIRNSAGNVIGVTPNYVISGTDPASSFFDEEDPEEAEEISGLD